MGAKNRDRIPIASWRMTVETVADMERLHWDVISKCGACGLLMRVDLALIISTAAPTTSLWNRHARCKRIGCQGMVEFQARPPGASFYETLSAPWPEGR
jgi:hypothetical protein